MSKLMCKLELYLLKKLSKPSKYYLANEMHVWNLGLGH